MKYSRRLLLLLPCFLLACSLGMAGETAFEFRGIKPGESSLDQLASHEMWKPYSSRQWEEGGVAFHEYQPPGYRRAVAVVRDDVIVAIDVFLPEGVSAEQAAWVFKLGAPQAGDKLPSGAGLGTAPGPGWRVQRFDAGAAALFLSEGADTVELMRFYSGGGEGPKGVRILKVWTDHEEIRAGGRGMLLHVNLVVPGRKDRETRLVHRFRFSDGVQLKNHEGSYGLDDGLVGFVKILRARYERSIWKDSEAFMPYHELHLTDGQKHDLVWQVTVEGDEPGSLLAQSEEVAFTVDKSTAWRNACIEKVWNEHDVYDKGRKGMIIHTRFRTKGFVKQNVRLVAYFYTQEGVALKDNNGQYNSVDGAVTVGVDASPAYEDTTYEDFRMFMPYDEFHIVKPGTYKLHYIVKLHDPSTNRFLAACNPVKISFARAD